MSLPAAGTHATDLATHVARLFFERQLSKVEIGRHLGISRFRVARLIDGALADGLVRIEYRDVPAEDRGLATSMEQRFGLRLCAVANGPHGAAPRLAAAVLDGLIGPGAVVGIAWGSTLAAVVREMTPRAEPSLEVVQLAGSSSRLAHERDAADVARALATRLGGTHRAIYAPAFVESADLRAALVRQPEIAATTDRFRALTLAVVGIGAMPAGGGAASSLLRSGVLEDDAIAQLAALGAVGDLVVHPFDASGRFVAPGLADRAVAIGVDELREVGRVMAVAAGIEKAAAIRGALATGLVDILVTDAETAQAVMVLP